MARFLDCSMLAAGLVLVLVAGLCLVNSGGRFACWFKKVAGWLRCFVWGPTRSSSEESADYDLSTSLRDNRPRLL